MKRIIFASVAILMAVISTQANPASTVTGNNSKSSKEERREVRKEKKAEKTSLKASSINEVSYQSKEGFYRDFGDRPDVIWSRTTQFDEARFTNNGVTSIAFYDIDSQLVGVTSIKTFADLPAAGQKQIQKDYKDYTVKSVVFYDDNEENDTDMILYGSRFDDADNYFVELQKDNKTIVVQVTMDGLTGYFTSL